MPVTVINRDQQNLYPLKVNSEEKIDISSCADWEKIEALCFKETNNFEHEHKEICLSFCTEEEIKDLNKTFRNKDKVTDVLSFNSVPNPLIEEEGDIEPLGDIIICAQRAAEQAEEYGYSLRGN